MSPSADTHAAGGGWDELLDALEARLSAWQGAVEGRTPAPTGTWAVRGPVPERLAPRAREVLARYRALEAALERRMGEVRAVLDAEPSDARAISTPLFVDRRA